MSATRTSLALLVLSLLGGCSVASPSDPQLASGTDGGALVDAGAQAPTPGQLMFTVSSVEVDPGQSVSIALEVTDYVGPVRLFLSGNAVGAYLDDSQLDVGEDGTFEVHLTAPGTKGSFVVTAVAGSKSTEIVVTVRAGGVTELVVSPKYAGVRALPDWQIDVYTDTTCDAREGEPSASAVAGADDTPIVVGDVDAGRHLTVVARASTFTEGCTDLEALPAGESTNITVSTTDLPLHLGHDLSFRVTLVASAEFSALLQARIDAMVEELRGGSDDDISALLDAMGAGLDASNRESFEQARKDREWYSRIGVALTQDGQIRTPSGVVRAMFLESTQKLYEPEGLVGNVRAASTFPGQTFIDWESVVDLPPESAGFPSTVLAIAAAEPGDTVRLGTTIPWLPNSLLLAMLTAASTAEDDGPAGRLAAELGCGDIAEALTTAVTVDDQVTTIDAYPGCNRQCTLALCNTGSSLLWQRITSASPVVSTLDLAAAGVAELQSDTNVAGFEGEWLGTASLGDSANAPVRGTFSAHKSD